MVLSPDGSTLYVLAGQTVRQTLVIDLKTRSKLKALPAPSNAVGLVIGADSTVAYSLVGTASFGNIQAFSLDGSHQ